MKRGSYFKCLKGARLVALATIFCTCLSGVAAWGVVVPPPELVPLNQVPVPTPSNLTLFVKDNAAAARLGKALFWEMQAGSDGLTACATCHFRAGADNRVKNTVHPGPGNVWEAVTGPNQTLPMDGTTFPFHQRSNPDLQSSATTRDFHDIVGSQGVRKTEFQVIVPGSAVDGMTAVSDDLFSFGGQNVRQVTGRNTPSMINAIFNFNNFWDGRAHFIFNGENPFGPADPNAGVWYHNPAVGASSLIKQPVAIEFASMASQAVGPALDSVEMSARGRTFPELGRKLLSLVPLGKQLVHPGDGTLGALSRAVRRTDGTIAGANGLKTDYTKMIQAAFQDNLWNSPQRVTLPTVRGPSPFSQIEANFALFWGLAIQAYEATLISDQTPFDRFLAGDATALTEQQQLGFSIFLGIGNCAVCHGGTEMTNVSHTTIAFVNNAAHAAVDLMFVGDGAQVIYDNGFNNTAVTPIADDIGRGANAPFTNPLSVPPGQPVPLNFSSLAQLQALGQLPFATPILDVFIPPSFQVNSRGLFKIPGLRNVELTPPYFHNGGARTLEEVVEFYVRGANFPIDNITELDPAIMGGIPVLQGNPALKAALVAFLKSLTDPRVAAEAAPFDHPELLIPEGEPEILVRVPAKDAAGAAAAGIDLTLNSVSTPTRSTTQAISGTVRAGMSLPQVSVNGGPAFSAEVSGSAWSAQLSGLINGRNSISVSAVDSTTQLQSKVTATIDVDSTPPELTLVPVTPLTKVRTQTLSGTVQPGVVPVVTAGGAAVVGPVTFLDSRHWQVTIADLAEGANVVTVSAEDSVGNQSSMSATITIDTTAPALVLNAMASLINLDSYTISGSVEAGATPMVTTGAGVSAGPVIVSGSDWSCQISGLQAGANTISVSAVDPLGNQAAAQSGSIEVILPDGSFSGGPVSIGDVVKALRMAAEIVVPSTRDLMHGDLAPPGNPNGRIDIADCLLILRKVAGL